ncbi:MAG: tetratricopeptide repeat protein, partial [Blastocatellia bacterium]
SYALAYAGLADSYVTLATPYVTLTGRKGNEHWGKAKAAALKALEIDESLAEAHASLGAVYAPDDDAAAHREFDRAIELNPNYASAYSFYAICLIGDARLEEALAKIKKARELDPLSVAINTNQGMVLCRLRRPDEAIAQLRKAEELDPNFMRMRWGLGLAYEQKAQFDEAIAEFQKAVKLSNGGILALAGLGHTYAMAGRRNEANQVLAQILEKVEKGEKNAYYLAAMYAGIGDKENALSVLETSRGNYARKMLRFDHFFDPLRSDPRFQALLRD